MRYIGQILFFVMIAAFVGYLSSQPSIRNMQEETAQIKLSFAHGAARKIDCRRLTSKEIASLPANQRRPNNCTRERIDMLVQLTVDGKLIYNEQLKATGLASDGPARTYQKFIVATGSHTILARLRDSKRVSGFDYEATREVTLKPYQNLAIDFKADAGGFQFN